MFQVYSYFLSIKAKYIPCYDKGSAKEFCILANGFWQAEGYIGGIFRSNLNFYPLCTATQLFSDESIKFFLRLDHALSNKGTINITLNSMGKFVIQYRLSGWDTLFSVFVPYFYMLYGAKFKAIAKLTQIYVLKGMIKHNSDVMLKVLLVKLAYSLTAHTSRYKLSVEDKLASFNINPSLLNKLRNISYPENTVSPCFLFILGFFRRWYFTFKIIMKRKKQYCSPYSFI